MSSYHLNIPQVSVVSIQDDFSPSSSTHTLSSFNASRTLPSPSTRATSPSDNHTFVSPPTLILRSAQNSFDLLGPPVSYTFDASSRRPPPFPTYPSRSSTSSRDHHPKDYDILSSSHLPPASPSHRQSISTGSSIGSTSTECDIEDSLSFRLCPVCSAHSNLTSSLPSSTHPQVDAGSGLSCIRRSSPSPSRETTYTGSETLRSDGQGTQQAYPVICDLKQAAESDDHQLGPSNDKHISISSRLQSHQETLNDLGFSYGLSPEVLNHVQLSTADQQSVNDVPASLPASSRTLTSPDKLHPTLSSWLKDMNELSGLIDRLQELASSAPPKYWSQLPRQVATLRTTFKNQQERCNMFLELSEECATRYLLDISAEIQQQRSFLDMLEKRLDMAKTLHRHAIDLRRSCESGTVNTIRDVSATVLSQPLPEDFDLFSEVDFVLSQIQHCYMELDKFWIEEIRRAVKALKMRRVDPMDFERWKGFHASLERTIESWWKTGPPSGDAQTVHRNDACSSTVCLTRFPPLNLD
ncbi:hypothetical protein BJV74DRAFT_835049 [Russula compacta]|nr:hypothetical protein BJV74DRAFT_835049 [Russula compacta]